MRHITIYLFILLLSLSGCFGSQTINQNLKLKIIVQKFDSWVNLMPGSKPSLFISGSLNIRNDEDELLDSVRLLKCNIVQNGNTLYELHPYFMCSDSISVSMLPGTDRIYTLHLSPGTPIKKELNLEKPISVDLFLTALNKIKKHKIDSLYVIKAF